LIIPTSRILEADVQVDVQWFPALPLFLLVIVYAAIAGLAAWRPGPVKVVMARIDRLVEKVYFSEEQIEVKAPVDRVFSYLADFTNRPGWEGDVVSVEKTSEGPVDVGSTFEMIVREISGVGLGSGKVQVSKEVEIVEFVPGRRLAWDAKNPEPDHWDYRWSPRNFVQVEPSPTGTKITFGSEAVEPPPWWAKYMFLLFLPPMLLIRPIRAFLGSRELRRLKSQVESEA